MKTPPRLPLTPVSTHASRALAAAALLFAGQTAFGASVTWNNTGTDINTGGSWSGGLAPNNGDTIIFNTAKTTQPNLSSALSVAQVYFSGASSSGYDLTSDSSNAVALTLTGTGSGSSSTIRATNTSGINTIDAALVLGGAAGGTQTFSQTSGGTLVVNGVISGGDSTSTLSLNSTSSTGLIKLTGLNTFTSNVEIIGTGSVVSVGSIGNVGGSGNLGAGSTILFSSNNTLKYTGAGESTNKTISLNNTSGATIDTTGATGSLVLTGDVIAPAGGAKTLSLTAGGVASEYQGKITDGAGGGTTAIKTTGSWILSGANTFSGGVTINSGTLGIKSASALGTGVFTPGNGSFDNVTNGSLALTTNNAMTLNNSTGATFIGSHDLNLGTGAVTLTNGSAITVNASTLTIGGAIGESGGSRAFGKSGAGTLVLNGNNTFTGLLTVNGGVLTLNGDNSAATGGVKIGNATAVLNINNSKALGTGALSINYSGTIDNTSGGALTLSTNNALTIASSFTFAGSNDLNLGTGAVTLSSGKTVTVNAHTLTIGGNIGVAASTLTKAGAGTLVLGGVNAYTGLTTVSGGALVAGTDSLVGTAGAFGNASSAIVLGDANTAANNSSVSLLTGGAYTIGRAITIANQATSGTYSIGGATDNNSTFSGAITLNKDLTVSQVATTGANALTVGGGISSAGGSQVVSFAGPGNITVAGTKITNGSGTVAVAVNGGSTAFNIANDYTGGTTVNAGMLTLGVANALASTGSVVVGSGTLAIGANDQTVASVSLRGGSIAGSTGVLKSNSAYDVQSGSVSAILGGNGIGLTKTTNGTVTLSATNTYTGATAVNAGVLKVNGALNASSLVTVTSATLSGSGTVNGAVTLSHDATLSSASNLHLTGGFATTGANNSIASGVITGNATVNANSGLTVAAGATLEGAVGSSGSLVNRGTIHGAVNVNGGTLSGDGLINGALSIHLGGTLDADPLAQMIAGDVTFDAGSILNVTLGLAGTSEANAAAGKASALISQGVLTLPTDGKITLNLFDNGGANSGGSLGAGWYDLISYGSLGSAFDASSFTIVGAEGYNYMLVNSEANKSIELEVIAVVPEPSTWAMLVGGLGVLVGLQHRRRRVA